MGQALCKDQVDTRPLAQGMTVWGDYINSDTRTIIAIMNICEEKFIYKNLDTLTNKHLEDEDFVHANPTVDLPVIIESHFNIISGPVQYVTYLINTREGIKRQLYNAASKAEIDKNVNYFAEKMRPVTGKLTRMLMARFIEDNQSQDAQKSFTPRNRDMQERSSMSSIRVAEKTPGWETIDTEINKGLRNILNNLNYKLHDGHYFGDPKRISIDDIMIYNDIVTIQVLANKTVIEPKSYLEKWFERMEKEEELQKLKEHLRRTLHDFKSS